MSEELKPCPLCEDAVEACRRLVAYDEDEEGEGYAFMAKYDAAVSLARKVMASAKEQG